MAATSLTTRIDDELKQRLQKIAALEDRSTSYMTNLAIKNLVEQREATQQLVETGLEIMEAGKSISEEAVMDWLQAEDDRVFPEVDTFELR